MGAIMSKSIELSLDQKNIVKKALGHRYCAIRGAAGSGKTLIAMTLAQSLYEKPNLELHDLLHDVPPVTVVAYNKSLANYLRLQFENEAVNISLVHDLLLRFVVQNGHRVQLGDLRKECIQERNMGQEISRYELMDAMSFIFKNGYTNFESYVEKAQGDYTLEQLKVIYDATMFYRSYMKVRQLIDYDDIANKVIEISKQKDIKPVTLHLIVDEVQDLAPSFIQALNLITKLNCYYVGDITQSLYPSDFDWATSLPKDTKVIAIDTNFRNSKQIFEAANSILRYETYLNENTKEKYSGDVVETKKEGHRPQVFFCQDSDTQFIHVHLKIQEIRKLYPLDSICIGYRKRTSEIAEFINNLEISGIHFQDIKDAMNYTDQSHLMSTLHSMKGLEFDHVILIGMNEEVFFEYGDANESLERRLMYVAMTRAKKSLSLFSSNDQPVRFIAEISAEKIIPIALNISSYEYAYRQHSKKIEEAKETLRIEHEKEVDKFVALESQIDTSRKREPKDTLEKLYKDLDSARQRVVALENRVRYFEQANQVVNTILDKDAPTVSKPKSKKILLLGGCHLKASDRSKLLDELEMDPHCIEHIEYADMTNFDITKLKHSTAYMAILVGSVPHSSKGKGDKSSLTQYLKHNQASYPYVYINYANRNLDAFTKSSLMKALSLVKFHTLTV